ncbi:hypothetical protein DY000_02059513 [Brassica cretica]|uniref:NB-ARC domain-containing protein n=1 Tax=Brassica cretica TaxID=69181 RepID=A0ABQ7ASC7_BRACR|nr:hypothetical protein DY000_02059513 [Brassica cretica]
MGGCFSVSMSCDQVVNQVTQWFCVKASYIHNPEENLTALETAVEELKAMQDDLSRRVEREEDKGLRRLSQIQVWLTRVETIESQVNGVFSVRTTELQRLYLCGFCSKSLTLSYRYGKRVFMMLKEVANLKANGEFDVVAEKAQASQVGMGGVGKTTLLTQINNKFRKTDDDAFDIVIWTVVSKDVQIKNIQEDVAKKLRLDGEDWNRKDKEQKACDIHNVLKRKKFVLLLDDIWEKVNLAEIGVPYPTVENGDITCIRTPNNLMCTLPQSNGMSM